MCGIVGYIGEKEAYPILVKGLKRLEYRGYDSAGVALLNEKGIEIYKKQGKVVQMERIIPAEHPKANIGIGHTRWATHGVPSDENSHPHYSQSKKIAIIHNGIIENYASIKSGLEKRGYTFKSDTDTEVLVNLIEEVLIHENVSIDEAVRIALNQVVGAYAIAVIEEGNHDQIVVAKKGSPLVIGIGEGEYYIASDATPFIEYTKQAVYLEEEELAILSLKDGLKLKNITNEIKIPYVQELALELESIEKGGYDHFMLKEINEQPKSIFDTLRGRLLVDKGTIQLGGFNEYEKKFLSADRIIIVACGTSWHAGLVA